VCAASLPEHDRSLIGNALVSFRDDPAVASDLSRFGLERFVAVTAADYAQLLVK
jgi:hypothetical protein